MFDFLKSFLDPVWFRPDNLARTWVEERIGAKCVRMLTVLVVVMLSTNAVLVPFAAYVDSVGIDIAFSMLELQVVVGLTLYLLPIVRLIKRVVPRRVQVAWLRRARHYKLFKEWLTTTPTS
ncbi:hypothetical protein SAMN04515659_2482 [Dyella sp. 333MFSha]|nr:hypothetical protein SAMN04515659_2482 [Dyella sp. 333MFSha]